MLYANFSSKMPTGLWSSEFAALSIILFIDRQTIKQTDNDKQTKQTMKVKTLPLSAEVINYTDGWMHGCLSQAWSESLHIPDISIGHWQCSETYTEYSFQWQIGCAMALWWLSQLWINNHIWFPTNERLAKVERLSIK